MTMHIAFVCPEPFGAGGISTYIQQLTLGLLSIKKDIEITILTQNNLLVNKLNFDSDRASVVSFSNHPLKWYIELTRYLLKNHHRYDWIEVPEFGGSVYFTLKLNKNIKNKLIVRLHTNTKIVKIFEERNSLYDKIKTSFLDHIEKYITHSAKLITSPSRTIAEIEGLMWEINPLKIIHLPNPLKLPLKISRENIIFENYNIEYYALYFGRLQKLKGVYDFLESIKYVKDKDVFFVLIGSDPYNIKNNIKKLVPANLKNRIIFINHLPRDKLARVIKDAKVVVLPSLFENFPYAVLETMALGAPLITTNVGGIKEIVTHLREGFLVDPGDPHQIAKWINFILDNNNEHIVNRITENAIRKVETFESSKIAKKFINMLD